MHNLISSLDMHLRKEVDGRGVSRECGKRELSWALDSAQLIDIVCAAAAVHYRNNAMRREREEEKERQREEELS